MLKYYFQWHMFNQWTIIRSDDEMESWDIANIRITRFG